MDPKSFCNEWGGNIASKACDMFIYVKQKGILWPAPWVSSMFIYVKERGTLGKLMTSKAHPAEVATAKLSFDLVQTNPVPDCKIPGKSRYL